jgi:hypothetical protein
MMGVLEAPKAVVDLNANFCPIVNVPPNGVDVVEPNAGVEGAQKVGAKHIYNTRHCHFYHLNIFANSTRNGSKTL